MTPLRNRMIREMERQRMSPDTIKGYVAAVADLARHYRRSPDKISRDEVRDYFHYLLTRRKLAAATVNAKIAAIGFFFREVLRRRSNSTAEYCFCAEVSGQDCAAESTPGESPC